MIDLNHASATFQQAAFGDGTEPDILTEKEFRDALLAVSHQQPALTHEQFDAVADSLGLTANEKRNAWLDFTGNGVVASVPIDFMVQVAKANTHVNDGRWTFAQFKPFITCADDSVRAAVAPGASSGSGAASAQPTAPAVTPEQVFARAAKGDGVLTESEARKALTDLAEGGAELNRSQFYALAQSVGIASDAEKQTAWLNSSDGGSHNVSIDSIIRFARKNTDQPSGDWNLDSFRPFFAAATKLAQTAYTGPQASVNVDLTTLDGQLKAQLSTAEAANDPGRVLMLSTLEQLVSFAKDKVGDSGAPLFPAGGAVSKLLNGQDFGSLMTKLGAGDWRSWGAVVEDLGVHIKGAVTDPQTRAALHSAGAAMEEAGESNRVLGEQANSPKLQASGVMTSALGRYVAGLSANDSNNGSVVSGGLALAGAVVTGQALLNGQPELIKPGADLLGASKLTNTTGGQAGQLSDQLASLATVGVPLNRSASAEIASFSNLANVGQVTAALTGGPEGAAAAAANLGISLALQALGHGDTPSEQKLVGILGNVTGAVVGKLLSHAYSFTEILDQICTVTTKTGSQLVQQAIVSAGQQLGLGTTASGVEAAANVAGNAAKIGGAIGLVYSVVKFGMQVADIADRKDIFGKDLPDSEKIKLATYALSDTLASAGLTLLAVPVVGWVVLAVAGVVNVGTAIADIVDNGFNKDNFTRLFGGMVGEALFPPRVPNAWLTTFIPKTWDANYEPTPDANFDPKGIGIGEAVQWARDDRGVFHRNDGNRDAWLYTETNFGVLSYSMHEFPRDYTGPAKDEIVSKYEDAFVAIRDVDSLVAKTLDAVDGGTAMKYYRSHTDDQDNRFAEKGNLDKLDFAGMMDHRYQQIFDKLEKSGSPAAKTLNQWVDGLNGRITDRSGNYFTVAKLIAAAGPDMLTISPEIIQRITNTVKPGPLASVGEQIGKTVGTFLSYKNSPYLPDSLKGKSDSDLMDATIASLGLSEDMKSVATPKPSPVAVLPDFDGAGTPGKMMLKDLELTGVAGWDKPMIHMEGMSNRYTDGYEITFNGKQYAFKLVGNGANGNALNTDNAYFEQVTDVQNNQPIIIKRNISTEGARLIQKLNSGGVAGHGNIEAVGMSPDSRFYELRVDGNVHTFELMNSGVVAGLTREQYFSQVNSDGNSPPIILKSSTPWVSPFPIHRG